MIGSTASSRTRSPRRRPRSAFGWRSAPHRTASSGACSTQGLRLVGLGVAAERGLLLMTRVIADLVAGVSPTDPITFVGTAIVLALTGLVASYSPARRAT